MYWLSADYWILIISFCGPCRPNVESMNHSIVLVLLGKGWYYLKKLVLKEKHLNMNVYIFLFSTVFIVLLHLEGICPYIYSSITVIQIFVTKNNICPFSPFRKHPLHIFTQLQILTCALKFHWKRVSLWDSHNVKFQNVCVICYAWWGQLSYQNDTGGFADSRILNRVEIMWDNMRHRR